MKKLSLASAMLLFIFGCEEPAQNNVTPSSSPITEQQSLPVATTLAIEIPPTKEQVSAPSKQKTLPPSAFMSAEWVDLIPKDDLDALLNPPDYIDDIAENSDEDQLNEIFQAIDNDTNDRYQQALVSTRVIEASDNLAIKIPAFIVPLEFDDEQNVTQFFMVPFFGACIHMPPPPPNQTIFVDYPQGFKLESLTDPYWISGILKTSLVENEMATAAYTMEVHAFEPYSYE